jgi:hypothetical protein
VGEVTLLHRGQRSVAQLGRTLLRQFDQLVVAVVAARQVMTSCDA